MFPLFNVPEPSAQFPTVVSVLPGPDRKRLASVYRYHVAYRSLQPNAPGCVAVWEVEGGRMPYQVALERDERGNLAMHCTCADAVFRAADQGRFCKHVRGLLQLGAPAQAPAAVVKEVSRSA